MAKAKKRKAKARPRAKRAKTTSGQRFSTKIAAFYPDYMVDRSGIFDALFIGGDEEYE